jgi:hypothetical protein
MIDNLDSRIMITREGHILHAIQGVILSAELKRKFTLREIISQAFEIYPYRVDLTYGLALKIKETTLAPTFPHGEQKEVANIWDAVIPRANFFIPTDYQIVAYSKPPKHNGDLLILEGFQLKDEDGKVIVEYTTDSKAYFAKVTKKLN